MYMYTIIIFTCTAHNNNTCTYVHVLLLCPVHEMTSHGETSWDT